MSTGGEKPYAYWQLFEALARSSDPSLKPAEVQALRMIAEASPPGQLVGPTGEPISSAIDLRQRVEQMLEAVPSIPDELARIRRFSQAAWRGVGTQVSRLAPAIKELALLPTAGELIFRQIGRLRRTVAAASPTAALGRIVKAIPEEAAQRAGAVALLGSIGGAFGGAFGGMPGAIMGGMIGTRIGLTAPLPVPTQPPPAWSRFPWNVLYDLSPRAILQDQLAALAMLRAAVVPAVFGTVLKRLPEVASQRQQQVSTLEGGHGAATTTDKTVAGLLQRITSQQRLFPGARW